MSSGYWALEAHDRTGQVFVYIRSGNMDEIKIMIGAILKDPKTGGVVIYRPTEGRQCKYCGEIAGHNADCPTIS